jgi:glycosyltransferase involved in cell wall biosynthesis
MAHGLPVVAYDAGAVAEVMGDAGVLLDAKSPRRVATEVAGLLADQARQDELRAAGRARLQSLGLDRAGGDMVQALVDVAAQP